MSTKSGAADTFQQLLMTLRKTSGAEPEVADKVAKEAAADKSVGVDAPDNADSIEQGKGAGSTVADIKRGPAERQCNGNEPSVQELGQDPSSGEAPTPKKSEAKGVVTDCTKVGPELLKTAESLEAMAKDLLHTACAEVLAELCVKKYAEAVEEAATGLGEEVGVDPETAKLITDALASGEITEEELAAAKEQTDAVMEIAQATGADPGEVIQYAQQIDDVAVPQGLSADDVAGAALQQHQAQSEQAMIEVLRKDFTEANEVLRKAEAENDEFTAMLARGHINRIQEFVTGHAAGSCDLKKAVCEPHKAGASDKKKDEKSKDDKSKDEKKADEAAPASGDTSGEEQLAAEMLGSNVSPDELSKATNIPVEEIQVAKAALSELATRGVPSEVLHQALVDEFLNRVPVIPHNATAEQLAEDPKMFTHVFLRSAIQEHRISKQAKAQG